MILMTDHFLEYTLGCNILYFIDWMPKHNALLQLQNFLLKVPREKKNSDGCRSQTSQSQLSTNVIPQYGIKENNYQEMLPANSALYVSASSYKNSISGHSVML